MPTGSLDTSLGDKHTAVHKKQENPCLVELPVQWGRQCTSEERGIEYKVGGVCHKVCEGQS